jgi:ribosomal protein S27E
MIYFQCEADGCANKGIAYYWDEQTETHAQCGGCGATLEAQND